MGWKRNFSPLSLFYCRHGGIGRLMDLHWSQLGMLIDVARTEGLGMFINADGWSNYYMYVK
jgi:hypothetical protein